MKFYEEGGRNNQEIWSTLQDRMVNDMSKFIKVFSSRLEGIK